jgi:hypothetical protein
MLDPATPLSCVCKVPHWCFSPWNLRLILLRSSGLFACSTYSCTFPPCSPWSLWSPPLGSGTTLSRCSSPSVTIPWSLFVQLSTAIIADTGMPIWENGKGSHDYRSKKQIWAAFIKKCFPNLEPFLENLTLKLKGLKQCSFIWRFCLHKFD